ncbi:nuclear condensing complex subunit [Phlyctochytrium arcticum]|nr:nuclear condensing complex subunit [Phlyctochytrium arcticum]
MLQHDPNADVRKAVLWNIEVNSISLPYMLQRARDVDAQVRKLAFMKVGEDVKKMTLLTVPERDALMNSGLSDRDSNVQKSCVKLMCEKWLPQCDGDMMTFLRKMDVIDGKAAESAVRAFLLANPSLDIPYNAETWNNLDVEEAAFLRSAIVHFAEDGMEDELEAALPPLIEHSDILKRYSLLMAQTEDQAEKIAFGFILKQLLLTAEQQDFTDEMGRREMLISLRDILSSVDLSKENILIAVGILKKLSLNEGDFTRVIIEILYTIYDPETMESGEMDEELDEIEKSMLLLKCLDLTACVLECTEENLRENSAMNGILTTFILPALKNEHGAIQYAGLQNLGLMCLLDKDLAKSHLPIFTSAFVDNRQAISLLALKEFFDLTILFGPSLLADSGALSEVISETLQCDDEELLALAVEGAAKLMILGYLSDPTILQQIIILYFHPLTKDMNRLRQCLSYFLPVYSHASCKHQKLLRTVIVPCLQILIQEHVVSKDAMIQPLQIGQQLVDWTDVRKVVGFERGSADVDEGLHADLAIDLLEASILDEDLATQKLFCQLLNRLYFGSFAGLERIARVAELINTLKEAVPSNSPILPNLRKFAKTISDMNEASFTQETETEFLALQTLTTALSELRIELGGPAAAAAVDMGSTDTVGGLVRGSGEPEPEADAQDGEEDDEEEEDSS